MLVASAHELMQDERDFVGMDTNAYRYLRFDPTSVVTSGAPCCGANNYGLNERWVFGDARTATPEPATALVLAPSITLLVSRRMRKRRG